MNDTERKAMKGDFVTDSETGIKGHVVGEVSYRLPGRWFDVKCTDGIVRMYSEERLIVLDPARPLSNLSDAELISGFKKAMADRRRSGSRLKDGGLDASRAKRASMVAAHSRNCDHFDKYDSEMHERGLIAKAEDDYDAAGHSALYPGY